MASQRTQRKTARATVSAPETETTAGYGGEPVGDEDGHLVIALAALVVAIVGVTVVMIVLTAT